MSRKDKGIADQIDYTDAAQWPLRVVDYATGMSIVSAMWETDRAYAVQDLTIMAQARFELSRQRRLPSYYLDALRKMARRHVAREAARAAGSPFPVAGEHAVSTPLPVAVSDTQLAQIAALQQESAASAGNTVLRMP